MRVREQGRSPRRKAGQRGTAGPRSGGRARRAVEAEAAAARLGKLQAATAALSAAATPAEVARAALSQARELVGAAGGALWQGGGEGRQQLLEAFGYPEPLVAAWRERGGGPAGPAFEAGAGRRPVWLESERELAALPPELARELRALGHGAWACVPVALEGRAPGGLALSSPGPRRFAPDERALVEALAQQCAQALERSQLYEEQRRLRAAAEQNAALLDAIVASAPLAIAVWDTERKLVRANPALDRMVGAQVQRGRTPSEAMPGVGDTVEALAEHVLRTGEPLLDAEVEGEVPAQKGQARCFSGNFYPVRTGGGDTVGVAAVAADVTEQRRAAQERERLLRDLRRTLRERDESMALLDALFATAPVGLVLLDREMRILRVNPALAQMNGIPAEQHVGKRPWEVVPELPYDELIRDFRRVLETGVPIVDREVVGETPLAPGFRRTWLETFYPVRVGGQTLGVGVLVRDVTAERGAAEFQRQLLGVVGHDLRSPLLAITSSATMLAQANLEERDRRAAERVLSSAARMDGIIRALVDYTLVQTGRGIPLDPRPTDFAEICRTVVEEAHAARPDRALECGSQGDLRGLWDPDRMGQVLANLVSNALAHAPEGKPARIDCRGDDLGVTICVANGGAPIPADFLPLVFEPFRRGPDAQNRKGLGLGLFIARQIVLAHGGTIDVRSDPAGTAFTVRLPRRIPNA